MASGKYGAYKQLKPLQGDIASDILNQENQDFKYREEKRDIEDRKYARDEARKEKDRKFGEKLEATLSDASIDATGFKSQDDPVIDLLHRKGGVLDQLTEITTALENDPFNRDLIGRKVNLEQSVDMIQALQLGLSENALANAQGMADKSLSKTVNEGYEDDYNKMINDFQLRYEITSDGRIVIDNKANFDSEGNIIDKDHDGLPDKITMQDLWNPGRLKGDFKTFSRQEYFDALKKVYKSKDEKNPLKGRFGSKRTKGFNPDNYESLKDDVERLFGKDLKDITNDAKSFIGDELKGNWKGIKEKEFDELKARFIQDFVASYDQLEHKEIDHGSEIAYKREERLQEAANEKVKDQEDLSKLIQTRTDAQGKEINTLVGYKGGELEVTAARTVLKDKLKNVIANKDIDAVFIGEDKEIYFTGIEKVEERNEYGEKMPVEHKRVYDKLNSADLSKVAAKFEMSAGEWVEWLKKGEITKDKLNTTPKFN